jgi:hypothetical protein
MYNEYVSHATPQRLEEPEQRSAPAAEPFLGGVVDSVRSLLRGIKKGEGKLFSGIPVLEKLDSGDLLLILVLLFLYRESEDEEWLIILALVVLMGL